MKKAGTIIALMFMLAFLQATGTPTLNADEGVSSVSTIIVSPSNQTYESAPLSLKVTVYWNFASVDAIRYRIDDLEWTSLSRKSSETEPFSPMHGAVVGTADLPELAEGPHKLAVEVECTLNFPTRYLTEKATAHFAIDKIPLKISSLSIENATYNQQSLPLTFTVNEPTSWIGYSVDKEANITLTGNSTLSTKAGLHSLMFYANDTAGNMGKSDPVLFTVEGPTPSPSPSIPEFPTVTVLAAAMVVTVLVAAFAKKSIRQKAY